jgi:hypothetical protein
LVFDASRFALPLVPPYDPGTSPYRVAGAVYKGLLAFVADQVPGGLDRVTREIRNPAIATFVAGRFSIASTADAVPLPYIGQAVARARGVSFATQIRDSNRWSARGSFFDVYRALVPAISPEGLTVGLARVAKIIQPFGGLKVEAARGGEGTSRCVRGQRTGVPHVLVEWMGLSTSAFLETALERLGSRGARCTFGEPQEDGRTEKQVTYTLPFEMTWG